MVIGNPFFNYLDLCLSLHNQPLLITWLCHEYVQAMRTCRKWTFSTLGYMHDNYHKEYKLGNSELNNLTIILTMNKRHHRFYAWFFFPNNFLFNLFFFFFFLCPSGNNLFNEMINTINCSDSKDTFWYVLQNPMIRDGQTNK